MCERDINDIVLEAGVAINGVALYKVVGEIPSDVSIKHVARLLADMPAEGLELLLKTKENGKPKTNTEILRESALTV